MKYRIGVLEVTPEELAKDATDGSGKYNAEFWLKRIQQARENAYRSVDLYVPNIGDTHFPDALREELAAIGIEIIG